MAVTIPALRTVVLEGEAAPVTVVVPTPTFVNVWIPVAFEAHLLTSIPVKPEPSP